MARHDETLAAVDLTPAEIRFLCRALPLADAELTDLDERRLFDFDRDYVRDMLEEVLEAGMLGEDGVELLNEIEGKL